MYGTDAYSDKLRAYVDKITDSGSKAIILSSVTRRNFDRVGKITPRVIQGRSLHDYARCAERLACEKKVPFIDLYARSVEHHNEIGPKRSATYNPDKRDQTHFSSQGAQAIAGLVINELNRVVSPVDQDGNQANRHCDDDEQPCGGIQRSRTVRRGASAPQ